MPVIENNNPNKNFDEIVGVSINTNNTETEIKIRIIKDVF